MSDVFGLIEEILAYGEPDPAELPDTADELLALHDKLNEIRAAAMTLRNTVDSKAAEVIGAGVKYDYGPYVVSWRHGFRWKAQPEAVRAFVVSAAQEDPDLIGDLFNPNSIRKTGVEKVARALGVDPSVAVDSVLERVRDEHPRLQFKPKEA